MSTAEDPRAGLRLVEERLTAIPAAIRRSAAELLPRLRWERRAITATGLGSSRAHARFLVHWLEQAGLDARFAPVGRLASPPADAGERVLVAFSQGLSPNGCVPFAATPAWRRVVVVTAVAADAPGERGERLRSLVRSGVEPVAMAGEGEFGLLFRLIGPLAGYVTALELARSIAAAFGRAERLPPLDVDRIVTAIGAARERRPVVAPDELDRGVALLATGGYGELADNLRLKLVEGTLAAEPPVWDLLELAHGPFQQIHEREITFLALARRGATGEPELFARLGEMLDPGRHRVLRLESELPGALAIFEHEAMLNELVLADLATRGRDPRRWPGKDRAGPLYEIDRLPTGGGSAE